MDDRIEIPKEQFDEVIQKAMIQSLQELSKMVTKLEERIRVLEQKLTNDGK